MTYFVVVFVLWATDQLTWFNVGTGLGVAYVSRRLISFLFTKWLPTEKVRELLDAAEEEATAKWEGRVSELEDSNERLSDEIARLKRLASSQQDTIVRLRVEIKILQGKGEKAQAREKPRKPSPGRPATWWEVLGVNPSSPSDAVESAYRVLARRFHPDTPNGDLARMQEINAAMDYYRRQQKA